LEEPERAQERGGEHLPPPVHAHVEDVVGVEVELDPRAAVGNHARRVERLAGGQRLALVVVEEDAGGALELADDDPFGAVDDERALVGHEGKLTEVDFLTALFPDGPRLRLFVVVEDDEAQGDRKSTRLNSSHVSISYAVFCLKKKNIIHKTISRYCTVSITQLVTWRRGSCTQCSRSTPTTQDNCLLCLTKK